VRGIEAYTQGLMDLGATVCTRTNPACDRCPLAADCVALREERIAELPAPRKRKTLPTRHATWLVLLHRARCCSSGGPAPASGADCGFFRN